MASVKTTVFGATSKMWCDFAFFFFGGGVVLFFCSSATFFGANTRDVVRETKSSTTLIVSV